MTLFECSGRIVLYLFILFRSSGWLFCRHRNAARMIDVCIICVFMIFVFVCCRRIDVVKGGVSAFFFVVTNNPFTATRWCMFACAPQRTRHLSPTRCVWPLLCRRHLCSLRISVHSLQRAPERAKIHNLRVVPGGVRDELPVLLHGKTRPHGKPAGRTGQCSASLGCHCCYLFLQSCMIPTAALSVFHPQTA